MEVWIWRGIGLLGQGLFFSRFLVQWIASERRKESVIPLYFWYLSLSGGIILFFYAMHIRDPIFILGQSCGIFVYTRNLVLIFRKKKIKVVG
jgi:lipid-A-disaccharide synthase-like uncharacterized protein